MRARAATAIAIGASMAAVATLPGPSDAIPQAEQEERDGNQAGVAAAQADRAMRDLVERAVQLGLREQQRDADQRQEQLNRKPGEDVLEPHPAEVHADDPRERHREDADVEPREAADDDRDEQRAEREPRQGHGLAWYKWK